jgi:hypothetical protein
MTRNRDIAQILGLTEAENTTNASLGDGSGGGGSGVTAYGYDSSGGLLLANTTDHADGSLHWLGALNELYVWDSDVSKYYLLENTKATALGEVLFTMGASTYAYVSGNGLYYNDTNSKRTERYSLASSSNAAYSGNLLAKRSHASGLSSTTAAYLVGGYRQPTSYDTVEKFPFATGGNTTGVTDMSATQAGFKSSSLHSNAAGYVAGYSNPDNASIYKFTYASETDSLETQTLSGPLARATGSSSADAGYVMGGVPTPTGGTNIAKFLFSSGAVSTSGQLLSTIYDGSGTASSTHAYHAGGAPGDTNVIQKFPFSSDGNTTDVGDLTTGRAPKNSAGAQSATHGYTSGGYVYPGSAGGIIDRFPFSSDGNASDVGDLTRGYYGHANTFN